MPDERKKKELKLKVFQETIEDFEAPTISIDPSPLPRVEDNEPTVDLLGEDFFGRTVNAAQFGRMGSFFGLPGAVAGGALGFAIPPSGSEEADVLGELGSQVASRVPGGNLMSRFLRSASGRAMSAGGATLAGTDDPTQALIQGGGEGIGSVIANSVNRLARTGRSAQRIASDLGEADESISRISRLGPKETLEEIEQRGVDLQPGLFERFGDPSAQQRTETIAQAFSSTAREEVLKRAASRDSALQKFARREFGEEVPIEDLKNIQNVMSQLRIGKNGAVFDKGSGKVLMNLSSDELKGLGIKGFENLTRIDPASLVNSVARVAANPGDVGLDRISAVRRVLNKLEPSLDDAFQSRAMQEIINNSQSQRTLSELIPESASESFSRGNRIAGVINQMTPKKLTTLFGDKAPAAKLLAKAYQTFDPTQALERSDPTALRFALQKLLFGAISMGSVGAVAAGTGSEDLLPAAEGFVVGTALGFAAADRLGSALVAVVNNKGLAKLLEEASERTELIPLALRTLVSEADRNREEGVQFRIGDRSIDASQGVPTMRKSLEGFFNSFQN